MSGVKKVFPQLLKSLDEINVEATRYGIDVGLENRYYFGEMPNLEEFGIIFNMFDGGRLKYWHDVGHAHVQEVLFGVSQKVLLETLSDRLIGIHLHDVKGGYTDHNEPGCGEVDFDMVNSFLRPEVTHVIELNPRVEPENVRIGVEFLRRTGIIE
jgi:sugar phosphate isomerase/epimerase